MSSTSDPEHFGLLDRLAEEFAERFRRGERPALSEYTDRYPELADDIRELFPAMAKVEQVDEGQVELLGQRLMIAWGTPNQVPCQPAECPAATCKGGKSYFAPVTPPSTIKPDAITKRGMTNPVSRSTFFLFSPRVCSRSALEDG